MLASGRRRTLATFALAALAAPGTACAVPPREELVGRYELSAGGLRETWALADDGSCRIVRERPAATSGAAIREVSGDCEWTIAERDGRRRLHVSAAMRDPGGAVHRMRYELTPGRLPSGPVTIPLTRDASLRKVE